MSEPTPRKNRHATPRPFLKWVGGKGQLLPELMKRIEKAGDLGRYHEPFVGGGALFFELTREHRLRKQAFLSDNNIRLIEAYRGVRDDVEGLIDRLNKHKAKHSETYYYEVRARVPNHPLDRAARIIYLNKTCYNGLYRENSKGLFNVPFGRYKNPAICDEANLRDVAKALKKVKIEQRHFETVTEKAKAGDVVYFDPPYHPVSKTASFTAYDRGGLENEDLQRLLARVCQELHEKNVRVLLSNSDTPVIRELYKLPRFRTETVQATRAVNSRADRRGKVNEVLVRNF